MSTSKPHLGTIALHAGQVPDPTTGARAVAALPDILLRLQEHRTCGESLCPEGIGNIYTRLMNPTTDVFEQRIAAIEGGTGALAVASGQAATSLALLASPNRGRDRLGNIFTAARISCSTTRSRSWGAP